MYYLLMTPLTTAYNRLDEAHRAFHLALKGYHQIDDFRAAINSAIQALRNVTFALQNQKAKLLGFDKWYAVWQEKMKQDEVMKALHTARTVIVHQEDLKLHSTATARTKAWVDYQKMAFSFDPMKDSLSVAAGLYEVYIRHLPFPDEVKDRVVFEFERKWVYEKLPNHELLEAIAYSYHFLLIVLQDAERNFSLPSHTPKITSFCSFEINDEGYLKCLILTPAERCLVFSFRDGIPIQSDTIEKQYGPEHLKLAKSRYGDEWQSKETISLLEGFFSDKYPYNQMKLFAQAAVANLKKDGHLIPVSFLFINENTLPKILSHPFENQGEKIIAMDKVASEVIKNNARYALTITEVWQYILDASEEPFVPAQTPENTARATELLTISYMSSENIKVFSIPFKKGSDGKIRFLTASSEDYSPDENPHQAYKPIVDALQKVRVRKR